MSEEDSFSKLINSSPGSLRPRKRRPLNNRSDGNESTKESLTNFLIKESSLNDSADSLRVNESREDKHLDNLNLEGDESISDSEHDSTDSNQENNSDESDEYDLEQFEAECGHTRKHENTRTSIASGDTTDKSLSTSVINKSEFNNDNHNLRHNRDWRVIGAALIVLTVLYLCLNNMPFATESMKIPNIEEIKNNFSTQDDELWTAIESGIQDVVNFSRPSTFILLYKPEAEKTLEELLHQLTQYAACKITECSKEPITVTDRELNSPEMVKDYGRIIDKYRNLLEDKGVMIIKNLENVKGIPAQAFHSFCDEYSPLVQRSVFIFTMKINKLNNQNKVDFVDQYFRNKWTDIKVDTFNALITRMSSMVMEVKP